MSEVHNIPVIYSSENPAVIGKASLVGGVITLYLNEDHFVNLCEQMASAGLLNGFIISADLKAAQSKLKAEGDQ